MLALSPQNKPVFHRRLASLKREAPGGQQDSERSA
jgi:hypothetical protein